MAAPDAASDNARQIVDRNRPEHVDPPVGKAAEQYWDQTRPEYRQEQIDHRLEYATENSHVLG